MATYKTPDVYVEEISLFPPSVAEVETAIPAFIGYTEKALKNGVEDVTQVPTKITSLVEFKETFGEAAPVDVEEIELDVNNNVINTKISSAYYMYDSVRMFFNNGGGKCYVISIGDYTGGVDKDDFLDGLEKLKKQDEPTLILFPDAVLLEDDLYEVQIQALSQCAVLMDRFAVLDLLESDSWEDGVSDFRDKIGINNLKYGAAYTPYLKTNLSKKVRYNDINSHLVKSKQAVTLKDLTTESEILSTITSLESAIKDEGIVNGSSGTDGSIAKYLASISATTLKEGYNSKVTAFKSAVNVALAKDTIVEADADAVRAEFLKLFQYIYGVVDGLIDQWAQQLPAALSSTTIVTTTKGLITGSLKSAITKLNSNCLSAEDYIGADTVDEIYDDAAYSFDATEWGNAFTTDITEANDYYGTTVPTPDDHEAYITCMKTAEPKISAVFQLVNDAITTISNATVSFINSYENALLTKYTLFKNIISKVSSSLTILPPSGAVVGVCAAVDSSRGVWKAPANVSLNSVSGLTETIDSKEQEELNVDVVAGKSINAIRAFTGKGILIWGARTLAGNDNEWRYIPVRRFFNMVEESVKKSTYWAVFEPNDANTWIKVKSMIENYLTLKWKDGALAGAKPDEAFYVKVGLGVTMTAQDILEGRMYVEIGMAVVRPAEFIILKFSHKMQES